MVHLQCKEMQIRILVLNQESGLKMPGCFKITETVYSFMSLLHLYVFQVAKER